MNIFTLFSAIGNKLLQKPWSVTNNSFVILVIQLLYEIVESNGHQISFTSIIELNCSISNDNSTSCSSICSCLNGYKTFLPNSSKYINK